MVVNLKRSCLSEMARKKWKATYARRCTCDFTHWRISSHSANYFVSETRSRKLTEFKKKKRANQNEQSYFLRPCTSQSNPRNSYFCSPKVGEAFNQIKDFKRTSKYPAVGNMFTKQAPEVSFNLNSLCIEISVTFGQKIALVLTRNWKAVKEFHSLPQTERLTSDRALSEDFSVPDLAPLNRV